MKKKKQSFPIKTTLVFSMAVLLLATSGIGSARAALTYYSENYVTQMEMSTIGVSLLENGEIVAQKNYDDQGEAMEGEEKELLTSFLGENEKLALGKSYKEALSVQNSGNIDTFVRVVLKKSWQNQEGKETKLSPDLIEIKFAEDSGWIVGEQSKERVVVYYTKALAEGEITPELTDSIRISHTLTDYVSKTVNENQITYTYDYDGYSFTLDAEVDAVQTHNAKEAIKSAWGVDVTVSADESSLSL